MSRKFRYTAKVIKEALKDSEKLRLKGLLAMWQYNPNLNSDYTTEIVETFGDFTTEFRPSEESFMASIAIQYKDRGYLSPNQLAAVKRRMGKYASFLAHISNMEKKLPTLEAKDPGANLEEGRKIYYFRCEAGSDGPYENPALFFARSRKAVKARIMLNDTEARSLWVPVKSSVLVIPGDEKEKPPLAFLGIPKWLCEKNKISLDIALDEADLPSVEPETLE